MKDLVRFLFEKTGHQVNADALQSSNGEQGETISLSLGSADINKFAGSEARMVRSFRALLSVAAAARNTKVTLEINEAA